MPHGKGGQQSTRKNPRDESSRDDDFELEVDPTAREDTLSPLYSASTAGSASAGSSVSSSQLEMILAANSKILADSIASNQRSMEASHKSMETSFLSALSTLSSAGSVAPSVASAPPPAVAPSSTVKVPKWTDGDQPFPFFTKLETAFTHNKVDKATWGRLLPVYLSGRAEIAFTQVDSSLLGDYDAVKSVLLKALGDTPAHAERHWWSLARLSGETPADFFSRVRHTGLRRLSQLPTREAVVDHVILSRFLSLLPVDSYAAVMAQHPKTGLEAAEFLLDFEETRAYSRTRQPWTDHQHHHRREPHRSNSPNNSSGGTYSSGTGGGNTSSGSGVVEVTGGNSSAGAPASGGSNYSGGKHDRGRRKPVICHNCGEPGHIRPNCPNRVRSVRSPEHDPLIKVDGVLAGEFVSGLQIDTGAGRSVVNARWVPKSAYLKTSITLDSWRGKQLSKHRLAKLKITVGKVSVNAVVAVAEELDCPALLGLDLGDEMNENLAGIIFNKVKAARAARSKDVVPNQVVSESEVPMQIDNSVKVEVPMHVEQVSVPRAQAKKAAAVDKENDLASTQSECEPVALSDVLDFPDSYFEPDEVYDTAVTSLDQVEEVAIPLPELTGDVVKLSDEQKNDEPVALENIFCFSDSYFEPEVACDAPAVAIDDTFCLSVCPFEPEEAGDASSVALEDIFWPDLGEVEFPLPDLDDDVLEASVAPACSDTFVVPRQLTEVKDEVLEVLEANVAPVCGTNIVVPIQQEEVKDEVLEASVAPVNSDKFVVPMQQVDVKVDLVETCVAPADDVFEISNFSDEFFVEDQADDVAPGPVDSKPMVLSDVSDFVDSFSEADPVFASVPVARPELGKVVVGVTLVMEGSMPPKSCWQSPSVLVDTDLRFRHCYTKATGKIAPGSSAFSHFLVMSVPEISAICSFCSCISMCLSKFLVVLFFGDFGPRAVPLFHRLDDPLCRIPEAPTVSWTILTYRGYFWTTLPAGCQKLLLPMRVPFLYPCLRQMKGGEMLWSLPP